MIKSILINPVTGRALDIHPSALGHDTLMSMTASQAMGQFKSAYRSTAGTTIIAAPPTDGAIVLTDLIISCDKVNAATITIQLTDGVNTVIIFLGTATDAPINISTSFAGRWRGWVDGRLEMVTVGTLKCTVAVGYFKVGSSVALSYTDWDAGR